MTTQLDSFIGLGKETTYGTAVTPSSFLTFTEETLDLTLTPTDAQGMRPGRRTTGATQRVITKREVGGDITVEATPAEPGVLFAAFLGAGANTLLSGSTYQHLFTMSADYLPSYTIQKALPPLGGGAAFPFTITGCQCSQLELQAQNGAIPTIKTTWMGKDIVQGGGTLATPVYPAVNEEFSFVGGSLTIGGTLTMPTASTLASGGTSVATVTDIDLKFDNALDTGGFTLGAGGARSRPAAALLGKFTGSLTAEFRDETFWNQFTGQTRLALVLNFVGSATGDGSYSNTLQIVLPVVVLEGEMPKVKAGSIITQSIDFTILQDLANGYPAIYAALINKVAAY